MVKGPGGGRIGSVVAVGGAGHNTERKLPRELPLSSVNATKFRPLRQSTNLCNVTCWCLGCWRFRTLQEPRIGAVAWEDPRCDEGPRSPTSRPPRRDSCLERENGRGTPARAGP